MAGGAPSVWRAVSVTILVLLASSGRVKVRLDDALAISAACFILYQPFVLFQPGFQLSYLAACSLIYSSGILAKAKTAIGVSFLVTSISQLSLYPVLLFIFMNCPFHHLLLISFMFLCIQLIILPANIVLLIMTSVLPKVADLLFMVYEPFREIVGAVTSWISSLPYQLWTPGKPDALLGVSCCCGSLVFFIRCEEGVNVFKSLPIVLVPALVIHFIPYMDSSLKVTFLDVGQGDSIVIELPYRQAVYVIDTGGTITFGEPNWKTPTKQFEVGRKIVVPYLKGRGITTIDKLIISHADADHMEGADEVLEEIKVAEIHISPGSELEIAMKDIIQIAEDKRIPMLSMKEGVSWTKGNSTFHYVAPKEGKYDGNASSLVLFMKTSGPSFLFTGDMEKEGEAQFLRDYGHSDFGSVILKAGHHGSRTSSTEPFVDALRPELTIFSAGRNNRYGHPHPEVVETFEKYGLPTMSTAEFGSITVTVKKDQFEVSSMKK